jgi:hypothetical protein
VVDLQIPVDYELHVNEKGQDSIRAAVAQAEDFTEPVWQHAFDKHGPRLD